MKSLKNKALIFSVFILLGLTLLIPVSAQTIERQVVSSSGTTYVQGGYSLDFTLGEMMDTTLANGETLNQGFHQVWAVITAVGNNIADLEIRVYPNPMTNMLNIEGTEKTIISLSDLQGRVWIRKQIEPGTETMDVSLLPIGTYFIRTSDEAGKRVKNFKLVKVAPGE
jgi:hypothetical protein